MFLAQIMQLYLVPVPDAVLADLPEHTGGNSTAGAAVLDAALSDGIAHLDHGALLWALDFASSANSDCVVPGFLDWDEVDFVFELAVDVVQKGVPFFFG